MTFYEFRDEVIDTLEETICNYLSTDDFELDGYYECDDNDNDYLFVDIEFCNNDLYDSGAEEDLYNAIKDALSEYDPFVDDSYSNEWNLSISLWDEIDLSDVLDDDDEDE